MTLKFKWNIIFYWNSRQTPHVVSLYLCPQMWYIHISQARTPLMALMYGRNCCYTSILYLAAKLRCSNSPFLFSGTYLFSFILKQDDSEGEWVVQLYRILHQSTSTCFYLKSTWVGMSQWKLDKGDFKSHVVTDSEAMTVSSPEALQGLFSYSLRQTLTRSKGFLSKLTSLILHLTVSQAVVHWLGFLVVTRLISLPFPFSSMTQETHWRTMGASLPGIITVKVHNL